MKHAAGDDQAVRRTEPNRQARKAMRGAGRTNQTGRVTLNVNKLLVGALAVSMANAAFAGTPVPLGTTLGATLGVTLGRVLGFPLGEVLPIASGGLLLVAAVSLAVGIAIVRRKHNR
jgi:hypothetical protein